MRWMMVMLVVAACDARSRVTLDVPDATPPDAFVSADDRSCDVLAQTGCDPGQKCTWLHDMANPPNGRIGCAPDRLDVAGDVCSWRIDLATDYDDCGAGLICDGYCYRICDLAGGAPGCDPGWTCQPLGAVFVTGTTRVAGRCGH